MKTTFKYNCSYRNKPQKEPDVLIEKRTVPGFSLGIGIPYDGNELQYFSINEARMLAYSILSMIEDEQCGK